MIILFFSAVNVSKAFLTARVHQLSTRVYGAIVYQRLKPFFIIVIFLVKGLKVIGSCLT